MIWVTSGFACWLALATQLRALAILILPVAILLGTLFAFRTTPRKWYARLVRLSLAVLSLAALSVLSIGPFYMFSVDWDANALTSWQKLLCGIYFPFMDLLSRLDSKLWIAFCDYYLREWGDYRRLLFSNLHDSWPYPSLR